MEENKQGLILKEKTIEADFGKRQWSRRQSRALLPTKNLPISKQISNEQLIAEEKSLLAKEESKSRKITKACAAICGFFTFRKLSECSRFIFISTNTICITRSIEKHAEARMETRANA